MRISPITFKGTLTIRNTVYDIPSEVSYHTTPQQDKDLVEITQKTMLENMRKPEISIEDTKEFIKKIEDITGKQLKISNPQNPKFLMMGGIPEDYDNFERYNSAFNKIFFGDINAKNLSRDTKIIVDTLEPEERKELASLAMKRIQKTIKDYYSVKQDLRLNADLISYSNKQITDFPKIERILTKVLFYLDGNVDTPDPIKYAPKLYNARQAYLALFNRLQKVIGTNLPEKEHEEAIAIFKEEKMEYMKRAVGYLIQQERLQLQ